MLRKYYELLDIPKKNKESYMKVINNPKLLENKVDIYKAAKDVKPIIIPTIARIC
jgi:hypothetical protein